MPSHMPTYYSWAKNRPCTTNAVYGYTLRDSCDSEARIHHTTKESFPGGAPRKHVAEVTDRSETSPRKHESEKTKPINRGYVAGYVPVTKKLSKDHRVGVNLRRGGSVPQAYEFPRSDTKDTYLWHALSGTLVHCKNSNDDL